MTKEKENIVTNEDVIKFLQNEIYELVNSGLANKDSHIRYYLALNTVIIQLTERH
jgi:uncharacterized protein YqgQ